MKALKWGIVALCFVCLTACGQREPLISSENKAVQSVVAEEEVIPSEFALIYDGRLLECGNAWFGGEPFIYSQLPPELMVHDCKARPVSIDGYTYLSLEDLCEELGYRLLADERDNKVYIISEVKSWQIPEGYSVPVLMYHGVSDNMCRNCLSNLRRWKNRFST